ncbi:LysR family transcriptional regulator [Neorhizobium sp. DT-125]|uniref:LysR family transcriptional regulator n=1 Tax=Neorhizobium sp. DT-125 TaxID=3396163 RepID=UPI003F1AA70B
MDKFDAMRVFTRVTERRSFTLAAEDLGLPRSTLSDVVKQLETRLGVRLLQRTTRQISPTLDGEAYYQRCLSILAEVEDAEAAFSGVKPRGLLRIDVQGTLARHRVLPGLREFFRAYPDIEIRMSEGDRFVDLIREGVDCVLRVGVPQDSDMIARRLAMLDEVTLASPRYIEAHGTPKVPGDLQHGHCAVGFHSSATGSVLPLEFTIDGEVSKMTLPSMMSVNGADSYYQAALLGFGLIQCPRYRAEADLKSGKIVEVLPDYLPTPTPVSVLYPRNRQLSPRVRVFIDWLTALFERRV